MEPTNLNPDSSLDAALDERLRAGIAGPALADDGFSTRVLAALPPPQSAGQEHWLILAAGALGGLFFALAHGASLTALGAAIQQSAAFAAVPGFALPLAVILGLFALFSTAEEPSSE